MQNAPIAIFAYKRLNHLKRLLDGLVDCEGFHQSPVTIFVDGPRNQSDRLAVDGVRNFVSSIQLPNVLHVFSESNHGLRNAIYGGVSDICRQYGRVIVLEDDLVLSSIALRYFNDALDHYAEDDEVWSIVGYMYDSSRLRRSRRTVALPFAHPWGWATWDRAWNKFKLDNCPDRADLDAEAFRSAFDMDGLYPFTMAMKHSMAGHVNSWFIHWYYTVFQHGGRSIFPPCRVVDNLGLGVGGTHSTRLNPHDRLVKRPPLLNDLPDFGDGCRVDYAALDMLKSSWDLRVQRMIAHSGATKIRLRTLVG